MKKFICMLLLFVLVLTGCRAGTSAGTQGMDTVPNGTTAPAQAVPEIKPAKPMTEIPETSGNQLVGFSDPGILRTPYDGTPDAIRYVTTPDQLPGEDAFAAFDEAFFEEHSLVLITKTANSGSVKLSIRAIELVGNTATVTLGSEMSGDVGTMDMATWLLWAVVEKDLDCSWALAGDNGHSAPASS